MYIFKIFYSIEISCQLFGRNQENIGQMLHFVRESFVKELLLSAHEQLQPELVASQLSILIL